MNIIDHGVWRRYLPPERPEWGKPIGALFVKRESDGVDWYDYVRASDPQRERYQIYNPEKQRYRAYDKDKDDRPNFQLRSIKCNIYRHKHFDSDVVGTAVYDPTLLFPNGQRVIEITDYAGSDPHKDFGGKVYDAVKKTFSDPPRPQHKQASSPTPEQHIIKTLESIIERLEKLEHHRK